MNDLNIMNKLFFEKNNRNTQELIIPNFTEKRNQLLPDIKINGLTYPIINISHPKEILFECLYLGNSHFITLIPEFYLRNFQIYKPNFKIIGSNDELLFIDELEICDKFKPNLTDINIKLVIIKTSTISESMAIPDFIHVPDFISLERAGIIGSFWSDYSKKETGKITEITTDLYKVKLTNNVILGSPLLINGKVVGICVGSNQNFTLFARLSEYYSWMKSFRIDNPLVFSQYMKFPHYTNEQLYSIIANLNDRIKYLEKKMEN